MADFKFILAASSNPNTLRVTMSEASAPTTIVAFQDLNAPHSVSQQIIFIGLNKLSHICKVYNYIGGSLGSIVGGPIYVYPDSQKVDQKKNIEIVVGIDVAADQSICDLSSAYPDLAGLNAGVDYWIEQRNTATLKLEEFSNYGAFGFELSNGIQFNNGETYIIHFYASLIAVPADSNSNTSIKEDVIIVIEDTDLDITAINKTIDVSSATKTININLDYLANFPEGSTLKFMTNGGKQINTVIQAKPGDEIKFNTSTIGTVDGSNTDKVMMGNGQYLKLTRKDLLWHVLYYTGRYQDVGSIITGTRVSHNQIIADGATDNGNELLRSEYPLLFWAITQMTSGVCGSKSIWLDGFRTSFHLGDGTNTFGIPDLRGYFPRYAGGGADMDPDRYNTGSNNLVLTNQLHALKSTSIKLPIARTNNVVGAGAGNQLRKTDNINDTAANGLLITIGEGSETRPNNIILLPLIIIG